jgi:hypothetical protein
MKIGYRGLISKSEDVTKGNTMSISGICIYTDGVRQLTYIINFISTNPYLQKKASETRNSAHIYAGFGEIWK